MMSLDVLLAPHSFQVIARGNCLTECDSDLECTIKDILYQPDYGGMDYEDVSFCKATSVGFMFLRFILACISRTFPISGFRVEGLGD